MGNGFSFSKKKTPVYRWELNLVEGWDTDLIRNRIWLAVQCGQPIPGCVSVEALRVELIRRGEAPIGFHETPEETNFDVSQIEIEDVVPRKNRCRR